MSKNGKKMDDIKKISEKAKNIKEFSLNYLPFSKIYFDHFINQLAK